MDNYSKKILELSYKPRIFNLYSIQSATMVSPFLQQEYSIHCYFRSCFLREFEVAYQ